MAREWWVGGGCCEPLMNLEGEVTAEGDDGKNREDTSKEAPGQRDVEEG